MSEPPSGYRIGYGRPPRHTRFTKGQSGNPRGRPKAAQSLARIARRILNEKIPVRENGQRRTITRLEAMLKQLANKGISGDLRAIREVLKLPVETAALEPPKTPILNLQIASGPRPTLSAEPLSDEEWEQRYGASDPAAAEVMARRAAARRAIDDAFREVEREQEPDKEREDRR